jgi:hypothetical protein
MVGSQALRNVAKGSSQGRIPEEIQNLSAVSAPGKPWKCL